MTTKTILKYVLLSVVLGFGAFLAYQPHIDNPFPLIADEYVHISFATQLLEEGTMPFSNPYIATPTLHMNYEAGFHFFLAFLLTIIPGEPVLIYKYFAAAFFVINSLLLFYLVRAWSKKYMIALFAVFFFGTITSADGLLAHQYFVPLTLGITLLFASHIFLHKLLITHQHRYLALLAGTLLVTASTYPPTLFFFLLTAGVCLFSMQHDLASYFHITRRQFLVLLSFVSLLLAGLFFGALAYLQLLDEIIFHSSWSLPYDEYSLIFFFGVVPSVLGLVGIWSALREKGPGSLILFCWFFYSLVALYLFYLFEYSILVPFPRLFFFFLIGLSILAGYGASAILSLSLAQAGYVRKTLLIIPLCIGIGFHITQVAQSSVRLPTIITPEKYQVLSQFAQQYSGNGVVIADPLTSVAVYPITGNKVLNVLNSNIGGGNSTAVREFLQAPCADKPDLLYTLQPFLQRKDVQNAPFYILSSRIYDCGFLSQLPESSPELFLYILQESTLSKFQLETNLANIPIPEVADIVRPSGALDTAELINLMAGNTLVGDTWAEYYRPDGTTSGSSNQSTYDGVWMIQDSFFCYYYPDTKESVCLSIKQFADRLEFYGVDGVYRSTATLEPGNPLNQ
jgi:hypothetical protein